MTKNKMLQGYDRRPPHRPSQHQMMICMEASLGSLETVSMYRELMSEGASTLKKYSTQMHECLSTIHESLQVLCTVMDTDPRSTRHNIKTADGGNASNNSGNDSPFSARLLRNNSGGNSEWSNKKSHMVDELSSIFGLNERGTSWDDELMALDGQQPLDSDEVCTQAELCGYVSFM
jgi:hypothetical protein